MNESFLSDGSFYPLFSPSREGTSMHRQLPVEDSVTMTLLSSLGNDKTIIKQKKEALAAAQERISILQQQIKFLTQENAKAKKQITNEWTSKLQSEKKNYEFRLKEMERKLNESEKENLEFRNIIHQKIKNDSVSLFVPSGNNVTKHIIQIPDHIIKNPKISQITLESPPIPTDIHPSLNEEKLQILVSKLEMDSQIHEKCIYSLSMVLKNFLSTLPYMMLSLERLHRIPKYQKFLPQRMQQFKYKKFICFLLFSFHEQCEAIAHSVSSRRLVPLPSSSIRDFNEFFAHPPSSSSPPSLDLDAFFQHLEKLLETGIAENSSSTSQSLIKLTMEYLSLASQMRQRRSYSQKQRLIKENQKLEREIELNLRDTSTADSSSCSSLSSPSSPLRVNNTRLREVHALLMNLSESRRRLEDSNVLLTSDRKRLREENALLKTRNEGLLLKVRELRSIIQDAHVLNGQVFRAEERAEGEDKRERKEEAGAGEVLQWRESLSLKEKIALDRWGHSLGINKWSLSALREVAVRICQVFSCYDLRELQWIVEERMEAFACRGRAVEDAISRLSEVKEHIERRRGWTRMENETEREDTEITKKKRDERKEASIREEGESVYIKDTTEEASEDESCTWSREAVFYGRKGLDEDETNKERSEKRKRKRGRVEQREETEEEEREIENTLEKCTDECVLLMRHLDECLQIKNEKLQEWVEAFLEFLHSNKPLINEELSRPLMNLVPLDLLDDSIVLQEENAENGDESVSSGTVEDSSSEVMTIDKNNKEGRKEHRRVEWRGRESREEEKKGGWEREDRWGTESKEEEMEEGWRREKSTEDYIPKEKRGESGGNFGRYLSVPSEAAASTFHANTFKKVRHLMTALRSDED